MHALLAGAVVIAYCAACGEQAIFTSSSTPRCTWCDTPRPAEPEPVTPPAASSGGNAPGAFWLSETQIRDAHQAHVAGKSIRSIAADLARGTRYTPHSLTSTLPREWKRRGWFVRTKLDATILSSTVHGLLPRDQAKRDKAYVASQRRARGEVRDVQCAAIKTRYGKGRGERCRRYALAGDEYCIAHSPARAQERAAHLEAARARRTQPAPTTFIGSGPWRDHRKAAS
jgi:hypothetical protein